jgi:hypothetical protein
VSNAIGRRATGHGKRRKHGLDTPRGMHEWTKANKSARRWYQGVWLEETQDGAESDAMKGR